MKDCWCGCATSGRSLAPLMFIDFDEFKPASHTLDRHIGDLFEIRIIPSPIFRSVLLQCAD